MISHLDSTLEDLERLNAFVWPNRVRRFQFDLAETGGLSLRSPFDGRRIRAREHWLLPFADDPQQLALPLHIYKFEDHAPIWLASFHIGAGYPLCALIIQDIYSQSVPHAPSVAGPAQEFRVLKRVLAKLDRLPVLTPRKGATETSDVIVGHPNFAHHMWNEIPGVLALQEKAGARLSVRSLFSPLGPLESITSQDGLTPQRSLGPRLPTPAGSVQIDYESAQWLNAHLPDCASRPTQRRPVIWIAHRTDGRSCLNFPDFLKRFDSLCRTQFEPAYLFDSFSRPADFAASQYDPVRDVFERRMRDSELIFESLKACIAPEGWPDVRTTSGLTAPEAIALSRQADFYISPIGSIQHKIAWLRPLDGVIHGPAGGCNAYVARWHANQTEIAIEPDFIPPELLEDVKPSGAHLSGPRNMDYRFTDPDAAAALAFDALTKSWARKAALPPTP